METVNLYIDGYNFYYGSTRRNLKNGWCDFRALGDTLASKYFGKSKVGKIWYVTSLVKPNMNRSFDESKRQQIWLGALQGADRTVRISRGEFHGSPGHCREKEADVGLGVEAIGDAADSFYCGDTPYAIIVSGDRDQFPTIRAIEARYAGHAVLAIPPDQTPPRLESTQALDVRIITPDELSSSPLFDEVSVEGKRYSWSDYKQSKDESQQVDQYLREAENELRTFCEVTIKNSGARTSFLPLEQWHKLKNRIRMFLLSKPHVDQALVYSSTPFITRKIVDGVMPRYLREFAD